MHGAEPQHVVVELDRAGFSRSLFFDGAIGQWLVPVARFHPGIRRVLLDLLACRQPYRGLRRQLLKAAVGWVAAR